jgi:formylglycine-generating enzyme required for sulfatase activity
MVQRSFWSHPVLRAGLGLALLGLAGAITARLALDQRGSDRCPAGLSAVGARCCGDRQLLVGQTCRGSAEGCAATQDADEHGACVARLGIVSVPGGDLFIGAADWDGATGSERFPHTAVEAFRLDVNEVTRQRFRGCRSCAEPAASTNAGDEPGLPVTNISPEAAATFCEREGGRLPTSAEWVWAAAGASARRYPWGNSGLVCRRAAFGLEAGPCANAGVGPDLAGSRPDGATPEGLLDLAGNVAEWTREPDGSFAARGGSFRSRSAAELKSWAAVAGSQKALHIGFRCAYPP